MCGKYFNDLGELFWWKTLVRPMKHSDHEGIVWRHPFSGQTHEEYEEEMKREWARLEEEWNPKAR